MMRYEGPNVSNDFAELFGKNITPVQLHWLVKVVKHCRGRCRSNAALRNYLQSAFPTIKTSEVPREWKGRQYMALQFVERERPKDVPVVEEGDDDAGQA